ncbi:unnamed protein product, partial [Protopolystoma xenopodis]
ELTPPHPAPPSNDAVSSHPTTPPGGVSERFHIQPKANEQQSNNLTHFIAMHQNRLILPLPLHHMHRNMPIHTHNGTHDCKYRRKVHRPPLSQAGSRAGSRAGGQAIDRQIESQADRSICRPIWLSDAARLVTVATSSLCHFATSPQSAVRIPQFAVRSSPRRLQSIDRPSEKLPSAVSHLLLASTTRQAVAMSLSSADSLPSDRVRCRSRRLPIVIVRPTLFLLLVLPFLLLVTVPVDGLRCYSCNSFLNPDCNSPKGVKDLLMECKNDSVSCAVTEQLTSLSVDFDAFSSMRTVTKQTDAVVFC